MSKRPVSDFFLSLTLKAPPVMSAASITVAANADKGGGGGGGAGGGNVSSGIAPISPEICAPPSLLPHHPVEGKGGKGGGITGSFGKDTLEVRAAAAIAATKRVLNSEARLGVEKEGTVVVTSASSFFVVSCGLATHCSRGPKRWSAVGGRLSSIGNADFSASRLTSIS